MNAINSAANETEASSADRLEDGPRLRAIAGRAPKKAPAPSAEQDAEYAVYAMHAYETDPEKLAAIHGSTFLDACSSPMSRSEAVQVAFFTLGSGSSKELVIAFRGTMLPRSLHTDFKVWWKGTAPYDNGLVKGLVSKVLLASWNSIQPRVIDTINSVKPNIITVTGHSVGSGLATIALPDIVKSTSSPSARFNLVLFACFPTGSQQFVDGLTNLRNTSIRGYRHDQDPIWYAQTFLSSQRRMGSDVFVDIPDVTTIESGLGHAIAGYVRELRDLAGPIALSPAQYYGPVSNIAVYTQTSESVIPQSDHGNSLQIVALCSTPDWRSDLEKLAHGEIPNGLLVLGAATSVTGNQPSFQNEQTDFFSESRSTVIPICPADLVHGIDFFGTSFSDTHGAYAELASVEVFADGQLVALGGPFMLNQASVHFAIRSFLAEKSYIDTLVRWTGPITRNPNGDWGPTVVTPRPVTGMVPCNLWGSGLVNFELAYFRLGSEQWSPRATRDDRGEPLSRTIVNRIISNVSVREQNRYGVIDVNFTTLDGSTSGWFTRNGPYTKQHTNVIPEGCVIVGVRASYQNERSGIVDLQFAYIPWENGR